MPESLNPTLSVGFFSVSWYSLMYIVGFLAVYMLLKYRIKRGEFSFGEMPNIKFQNELLINLLLFVFTGLLIGARLGYVLFYDLKYFLANPLAIISPYDAAGSFVGIYGMSYHGGLLGALLFGWVYCRKRKLDFIQVADFVSLVIPAGYFFGRIGNFLNGELYGRITKKPWGMYFPTDRMGQLRHPSQLYEAFFEGLILFFVLWLLKDKLKFKGQMLGAYLFGYAVFRIFCEFFRESDAQIGFMLTFLTLGQILSLPLLALGIFLLMKNQKMCYNKGHE